jgi:demethylmenaquinone methyltransferase/2-methoxy-6-polyprenyl-1,4-benzoquinol methylase
LSKSTVKPYSEEGSKKEQVEQMFDNISGQYDSLNHILSMGIDKGWRKKAVREVMAVKPNRVLDVATGTGDQAIALCRAGVDRVTGLDLSRGMLDVGIEKIRRLQWSDRIEMMQGDSENLPFENNTFDAITVSFGVRNFENLDQGLQEMARVLKPGGKMVILEFSKPRGWVIAPIFRLYSNHILPRVGSWISKDKSAYTYLPESVEAFPSDELFLQHLRATGLESCTQHRLTFGIASIYTGIK